MTTKPEDQRLSGNGLWRSPDASRQAAGALAKPTRTNFHRALATNQRFKAKGSFNFLSLKQTIWI